MSRILSRISMLTGQISSHALQRRARPDLLGRDALEHAVGADRDVGVDTDRRRHRRRSPVAAITSPTFSTISRGSSGLPVACAGHTDVQRPQTVHASVSKQLLPGEVLDRSTAPNALELGLHEVRHRLHRALGAVAVLQVHVHRRREHVPQLRGRAGSRGTRGTRRRATTHIHRCASRSVSATTSSTSVESG